MLDAERGGYDICPTCAWKDDPAALRDPDFHGGANQMSLNEARAAFFAAHSHLHHDA